MHCCLGRWVRSQGLYAVSKIVNPKGSGGGDRAQFEFQEVLEQLQAFSSDDSLLP